MATIVRIDDEIIDTEGFVRTLKLSGQFEGLVEQMVRDKLTVRAAKKQGMQVQPAEIQERADQFRRVQGLHRAADMNRYLDALMVSLDEFEDFITDSLYQEKMMAQVCSDQAVEAYFKLNSPKFDSIEVSHIVLDAEGKAKEMMSVLQDDPDCFTEMQRLRTGYYFRLIFTNASATSPLPLFPDSRGTYETSSLTLRVPNEAAGNTAGNGKRSK